MDALLHDSIEAQREIEADTTRVSLPAGQETGFPQDLSSLHIDWDVTGVIPPDIISTQGLEKLITILNSSGHQGVGRVAYLDLSPAGRPEIPGAWLIPAADWRVGCQYFLHHALKAPEVLETIKSELSQDKAIASALRTILPRQDEAPSIALHPLKGGGPQVECSRGGGGPRSSLHADSQSEESSMLSDSQESTDDNREEARREGLVEGRAKRAGGEGNDDRDEEDEDRDGIPDS